LHSQADSSNFLRLRIGNAPANIAARRKRDAAHAPMPAMRKSSRTDFGEDSFSDVDFFDFDFIMTITANFTRIREILREKKFLEWRL
jgi:hypothetical protein